MANGGGLGSGAGSSGGGSLPSSSDLYSSVGLDWNTILQQLQQQQQSTPTMGSLGGGGGPPSSSSAASPSTTISYGFGAPYTAQQGSFPSGYTAMNPGNALDYSNVTGSPLGGYGYPNNWQQFQGDTSTGGGFWTLEALDRARFAQQNQPQVMGGGTGDSNTPTTRQYTPSVSDTYTGGAGDPYSYNLPSTNNWRLLPPNYRSPNYVMRNGAIIDLTAGRQFRPASGQSFAYTGVSDTPTGTLDPKDRPLSEGIAPAVSGEVWPLAPKLYYWPGGPTVGYYTGQME